MATKRLKNITSIIPALEDFKLAEQMYGWLVDLFPINRSLTGKGVRETLNYLGGLNSELKTYSVPSGTKAFDWEIPLEWNIEDAYIEDPEGNKIVDFKSNNLHVVGYSTPIQRKVSLEELNNHLFSLESLPNATPYVTSYYKPFWGFCLPHNQRINLKKGDYFVKIDSQLVNGFMNYGELFIPGEIQEEILFSTYICHPSMANNELSGPVLASALARYIKSQKRRYSYRILFVPETIGSIYYISQNYSNLKKNLKAGFILTCCGDDGEFSYIPSRYGNSYADKILKYALLECGANFKEYSFLDRGSDERQYCSPNIDLPVASVTKSKYGVYDEYHTSLDNLEFVSVSGLLESYLFYQKAIDLIENNKIYSPTYFCEPMLTKHVDYPNISGKSTGVDWLMIKHILAYINSSLDMIDLAQELNFEFDSLIKICNLLEQKGLIELI